MAPAVASCSSSRRKRAACKTLFDPDLAGGGNLDVAVRCNPTTGEIIRDAGR